MFIKKFLLLIPFILLTGCGHSFVTVDKGIGVHLKVPLPNGQPIVDLKLGYIDGKCFSTEAISKFLEISEKEIISLTHKVLLEYQEMINSIFQGTIKMVTEKQEEKVFQSFSGIKTDYTAIITYNLKDVIVDVKPLDAKIDYDDSGLVIAWANNSEYGGSGSQIRKEK